MKRTLLISLLSLAVSLQLIAQVENYCLRFVDGGGVVNCGKISTHTENSNYTLQMWICPSQWRGGEALMRCGEFSIRLGNDCSVVFNDGTNFFYATSSDLLANRWSHITLRVDAEKSTVSINNSVVSTYPRRLRFPCERSSIWLGGGYLGRMDEVRVWRTRLTEEYDSFWRNTLHDLSPYWNLLSAYWKMDQADCPNLVDYKGAHHGTFSTSGVTREKVTDNDRFRYLINLGYGNLERFFDRGIDARHYSLSNHIAIIGAHLNNADGRVYYDSPLDEATLANGATRLDTYVRRNGVLSLPTPEACLMMPAGLLNNRWAYTFETWLYLDEWHEGGYIFRCETDDQKKGVSLRLGPENERAYILRCNGMDYPIKDVGTLGKWHHVGFCPNTTGSDGFFVSMGGTQQTLTSLLPLPTNLPYLDLVPTLGEGLVAKYDDTMIFYDNRKMFYDDSNHVPLPGEERILSTDAIASMRACYCYDLPHRPGLDSFSTPGYIYKMRSYTEGMRGVKFLLTVAGNNFDSFFSDDTKRVRIADDIAAMANDDAFDGVDLDFEWTYTPWGWRNYGRLCENIHWRINAGKSLSLSPHYVTSAFPTEFMQYVDFFNFQVYDRKDLASEQGFRNAHLQFERENFPNHKIVLSYNTTTTEGYVNDKVDKNYPPVAYRYFYPETDYNPNLNYLTDSEKGVVYYLPAYNQIPWRARYVVENDLGGIMYWDMGGDLPSSHKHSYARGASYQLASNVDKYVDSVKRPAVSPETDPDAPVETPNPDEQQKVYVQSISELSNMMAYNIINANGLGTLCHNAESENLWLGSSSNANFSQFVNPNRTESQWLLIKYNDCYYLYSLSAGRFVEVQQFDVTSQPAIFTDEPMPIEINPLSKSSEGMLFSFRTYTDDSRGFLCAAPQLKNNPVCQWEQSDAGSRWLLQTAPYTCVTPYLNDAMQKLYPEGLNQAAFSADKSSTIYDLSGRLYTGQPKSGIYICNGHKILR